MPGPMPRCKCGDCPSCRNRERMRRKRAGEPPLKPKRYGEQRAAVPRSKLTLAYLAGLFDGEGYVGMQSSTKGWVLQIAMTDRDVVDWLGEIGGTTQVNAARPPRKALYQWRLLRARDVFALLKAMRPFLRVKAAAADLALSDLRERIARSA